MPSKWHEKQAKQAYKDALREEEEGRNSIDFEGKMALDLRDSAMGKGDEELYEKKMSKEEKKALAKAKREAKKKVSLDFSQFSFLSAHNCPIESDESIFVLGKRQVQ
jgi:hypothetical protein